jgi:hypothetical protein
MGHPGQKRLERARSASRFIGIVVALSMALCVFGIVVPVATIGTLIELGPQWAAMLVLSMLLPAWCFISWGAISIHYSLALVESGESRWRYAPRFSGLWPSHEWFRNVDASTAP